MPRINVNLDDIQTSNFELFPEGLHPVRITDSSKLKAGDGKPYIQIIAECIEGEMEGKAIGWRLYLMEAALWNLKGMLEALGFEWDEDGFELEDIYDGELIIKVTHQEYPEGSGEYRNNVSEYKPYSK